MDRSGQIKNAHPSTQKINKDAGFGGVMDRWTDKSELNKCIWKIFWIKQIGIISRPKSLNQNNF